MTVSYNAEVATAKFLMFTRLVFRWTGSVYKLIWIELIIFILLYILVAVLYRLVLNCEQRMNFDEWVAYCKGKNEIIPLTFVLGYYVTLVIQRWWDTFMKIAWPDRACFFVCAAIPSMDPEIVQYRRAVVRYLNLAQLLVLRDVSEAVKTRYRTLDRIVEDGLLTTEEKRILETMKTENDAQKYHNFWLVMQWASDVFCRAHDMGATRDETMFTYAFEQIIAFQDGVGAMLLYDWICIPLGYTQVVSLVVYFYHVLNLFASQHLEHCKKCDSAGVCVGFGRDGDQATGMIIGEFIEKYVPVFPILEFVFYMGWLKMAASIINPFGKDDDDFEINFIVDRNLAVSYALVDEYYDVCPQIEEESQPIPTSSRVKSKAFRGSAEKFSPSPQNLIGIRGRRKKSRRYKSPDRRRLDVPLDFTSPLQSKRQSGSSSVSSFSSHSPPAMDLITHHSPPN